MYTRARQDKTLFLKHAISKRCPCLRSRTAATLVSRFCPTGCVTLLDMSTLARVVDSFLLSSSRFVLAPQFGLRYLGRKNGEEVGFRVYSTLERSEDICDLIRSRLGLWFEDDGLYNFIWVHLLQFRSFKLVKRRSRYDLAKLKGVIGRKKIPSPIIPCLTFHWLAYQHTCKIDTCSTSMF
jgi:hypothetical protein